MRLNPTLNGQPDEPLSIHVYWHCRKCLEELPNGESPQSYRRLDVGKTSTGVQVWCTRHDINVAHFEIAHLVDALRVIDDLGDL